ncbi:hypothetical protein TSOC_012008 [Tetrabaena socialis]|uniref:ATPase domain-containing protein n=1 Tax=Tetrabaena socialis TaxID=47790 RepID=A0A2J7ZP36_9CHLO|nr:hypothetical protein TSOC_012008 [Tetrabaena socialis]|eukprot:PNH02027.1 hypothetical protein TSOC_012008 [Tetrabaena socialis]
MADGLAAGSSEWMRVLAAAAEVDLAKAGLDVVNTLSTLGSATTFQPRTLRAVLQVYNRIFEANKDKGGRLPVLVIDEANTLEEWDSADAGARMSLLRFFIAVTKENRQAHVLLASGSYAFYDWLRREVNVSFLQLEFIGDFSFEEGRAFLEDQLMRVRPSAEKYLTDDSWEQIYKVCGGNPGQLIACAQKYEGAWGPEVNVSFLQLEFIGDFSFEEGRAFLEDQLMRVRPSAEKYLTDDSWEQIYKVCGGNPGQLIACAQKYEGAWGPVLHDVSNHLGSELHCALEPMEGDGWAQAQLAAVVRALSTSEHGAVERLALRNQLGAGGREAVLALIDANILGLRCYSEWADDLPAEAWGNTRDAELITAASATLL